MEPYPPVDVYIFAIKLVESLGMKLDRNALDRQVAEVAAGNLTLTGSLEDEIAAAPHMEAYLRDLHGQPNEWWSMQLSERRIAHQILAELVKLHIDGAD